MSDTASTPVRSRRAFIEYFASIGLGSTLLPGILWGQAAQGAEITTESVANAAELAGLEFDDDERAMMVAGLTQQEKQLVTLHGIALTNDVVPAVHFNPVLPGITKQWAGTAHLQYWTGYQWNEGAHISTAKLRPGDLVFFAYDTSRPSTIHHVGMFIGNGEMVEAPYTGADVRISTFGRSDYIGAVRPYQR